MIRAIVLDVDGVIIGTKLGHNYPFPSTRVSDVLRHIHDNGIPVSFCSAKASFRIAETIKRIGLDNVHIADGGAVLYNPIADSITFEKQIDRQALLTLVSIAQKHKTYILLFSPKTYYSLKSQKSQFTDTYAEHIGQPPGLVDRLEDVILHEDIVKAIIFFFDQDTKKNFEHEMKKNTISISSAWAGAPIFDPAFSLVVTAQGVSKRSGVEELAHRMNVPHANILGVGDRLQDWDFLEICGYKGTMANASDELKAKFDFAKSHQFMGSHVNEDGLLDILKFYRLM